MTIDELKAWILDNTLVTWTKDGWLGEEKVSTEKLLQKLDQLDTGESKEERRLAEVESALQQVQKANAINARQLLEANLRFAEHKAWLEEEINNCECPTPLWLGSVITITDYGKGVIEGLKLALNKLNEKGE